MPKASSYELRALPGRGQPYLCSIKRAGDTEGLKPITTDFDLRRGVPVRFRLIDKETGKPVRGLVQYDLARDSPYWREAIGPYPPGLVLSPEWFLPREPDEDLFFNTVVYPGPGILF